jgi:hypothetical protein
MLMQGDLKELLKFTTKKYKKYEEPISVVLILLLFKPMTPTEMIYTVKKNKIHEKLKKPYYFNSESRLSKVLQILMFFWDEEKIKEDKARGFLDKSDYFKTGTWIYNSKQDPDLFDKKYLKDKRTRYYQIDFTRLPLGIESVSQDFQKQVYKYYQGFNHNSPYKNIQNKTKYEEIIKRIKKFNLITFMLVVKEICAEMKELIERDKDFIYGDVDRFIVEYLNEREFKNLFRP